MDDQRNKRLPRALQLLVQNPWLSLLPHNLFQVHRGRHGVVKESVRRCARCPRFALISAHVRAPGTVVPMYGAVIVAIHKSEKFIVNINIHVVFAVSSRASTSNGIVTGYTNGEVELHVDGHVIALCAIVITPRLSVVVVFEF